MYSRFVKFKRGEKILSFIFVVVALLVDFFMLNVYYDIYGLTGKMYMLVGGGAVIVYTVLVHYIRELANGWSYVSYVSSQRALLSILLIGIVAFLANDRYIVEEYSFFAMLVSYLLLISCTRMGTLVIPPVPVSYECKKNVFYDLGDKEEDDLVLKEVSSDKTEELNDETGENKEEVKEKETLE